VQEDNLVAYRNPGVALAVADPLTEVLRQGARDLLQKGSKLKPPRSVWNDLRATLLETQDGQRAQLPTEGFAG
jgi:hypothetical protein